MSDNLHITVDLPSAMKVLQEVRSRLRPDIAAIFDDALDDYLYGGVIDAINSTLRGDRDE